MALVETAPASHVEGAPPVFCMLLPVMVTFMSFVHTTASQLDRIEVGVLVAVLACTGVLVAVALGMDVLVGVLVLVRMNVGVIVRVRVAVFVGGRVLVGGMGVLVETAVGVDEPPLPGRGMGPA